MAFICPNSWKCDLPNEIAAFGLITMDTHDIIYTNWITKMSTCGSLSISIWIFDAKSERMASQDEGSQKWKWKKILEARAEMMRVAKKAHQQETHEESGHDREEHGGDGSACDDQAGPSLWWLTPEWEWKWPRQFWELESESEFGDNEAQDIQYQSIKMYRNHITDTTVYKMYRTRLV